MSLITTYSRGFFSCCSVKLGYLTEYINKHKTIPDHVDSSAQFTWYKINQNEDVTFDYFEHYDNINITSIPISINYHHKDQFKNYSHLDYKNILPIVKKYFSPSLQICDIIKHIENKYNLDYTNICVLFYRGNDKSTETDLGNYRGYVIHANNILKKNPNIKFLIQSDETEFINFMLNVFPNNSFYFKDETRNMRKCKSSVDILMRNTNYIFSKYFLAITIIMSKCKYIVCGSGNCSIWIIFYRGHNNNVYQYLNGNWLITDIDNSVKEVGRQPQIMATTTTNLSVNMGRTISINMPNTSSSMGMNIGVVNRTMSNTLSMMRLY